jgi:hypothetical protein
MATKTEQSTKSARPSETRQSITFEVVAKLAPTATQADKIASSFGLDAVDYHAVRETTEEQIGLSAKALQTTLDETAMRIHLQRVVGAFVASAYGAATFYGTKVTQARDLTSKLANDDRDEDRDGVYGFDSKASRARGFAAKAGLRAFALMAAAEGAVNAYAEITGEDWKPYEGSMAGSIGRRSAAAEMEALG